jgi:hypothetical protein
MDADGAIAELVVMLRPLNATVAVAQAMRERLAPAGG